MSITIATLRAAGLTAEQIVEILETSERERLANRREQNRINQRAYRQRVSAYAADSADTADGKKIHKENQSPRHQVSADTLTPEQDSSLSFLPSTESQKGKKEEKKERAKRDRGIVCPDDLVPSEAHYEAGARQGVSRPRVLACCAAMKDWSKSNANRAVARKVDWSAALFGWISRESERKKVNGHANPTMAAFDRLDARNALHEGQGDFGGLDLGGPIIEGR